MLLKACGRPGRVDLVLRNFYWTAQTQVPSGLDFFAEVVIRESYDLIRKDLEDMDHPLVIDGGANCGAFALWVLEVNKGAVVISFEPGAAFDNLTLNQQLNIDQNQNRWKIEKCALSSKVGMGSFSQEREASMGFLREDGTNMVPIRTINDLQLAPEVLKIDVEGHEMEVFYGSENVLPTVQLIVVEFHSLELRAQCETFLLSHGFVVQEKGDLFVGRRRAA